MKATFRLASLTLSLACAGGSVASAQPAPGSGMAHPELFLALGHRDLPGVKALLHSGASPNARNTIQMTALMTAVGVGDPEAVKSLLAAGAEIDAASPFGTALTFALMEGRSEIARFLIEKGAGIASGRPDRISSLMLAARAGDTEIIRLLLAKKADLNAVDNHGSTALSYAARHGRPEAVRALLAAGAKIDVADTDGWTALTHAAVNGHTAIVESLLQKGANPNARDKRGRTPLLAAASYGDSPQVIGALLARGAVRDAKDAQGRTALQLAEGRGYTETAKLLREKGARMALAALPAVRTPRQAAELSLRQVENSMQIFAKRTGCASCHHEGIARFTTGFARARGYQISEAFAREQEKRVTGEFERMLPLLRKAVENPAEIKNVPAIDLGDFAPATGSLLLGLGEHGTTASEALSAAAMVLARIQTPEGDWRFGLQRVPVQSSFFSSTAMAVRALKNYAPKAHQPEVAGRIARAKQWLASAPVKDNEDRAFRLLGLKWAGATPEERRKALEELRATQRPDGGWAQLDTLKSDAYATGLALFALNQGGELAASDPVYQRGVQYLLRTQEDDGTWYVYKRAIPANNYFDTEFPYGQSQYISHMAASWASMALMLAAEAPVAQQAAVR